MLAELPLLPEPPVAEGDTEPVLLDCAPLTPSEANGMPLEIVDVVTQLDDIGVK